MKKLPYENYEVEKADDLFLFITETFRNHCVIKYRINEQIFNKSIFNLYDMLVARGELKGTVEHFREELQDWVKKEDWTALINFDQEPSIAKNTISIFEKTLKKYDSWFADGIDRLAETFGEKFFNKERIQKIFEYSQTCRQFEFSKAIDEIIVNERQAPTPIKFNEYLSAQIRVNKKPQQEPKREVKFDSDFLEKLLSELKVKDLPTLFKNIKEKKISIQDVEAVQNKILS